MPAAAEYAWVDDWYDTTGQAYCLTLARDLAPREFLARLRAVPDPVLGGTSEGLAGLAGRSLGLWGEEPVRHTVIGVTLVRAPDDSPPWTLGVEVNGFLGVTPSVIGPLSAGAEVVSHGENSGAGPGRFYWLADGAVRLEFETMYPQDREGTGAHATDVEQAMTEAGFDLDDDNLDHPMASAFALAERLTGVRVTVGLLDGARYEVGLAPFPGG
jgi:hypothetical protein